MPGGLFSTAKLFGMTIRESATDGSDFSNPDADYRRLFLGEDAQLHVKDSAGAVTDIGSGSGIAATIFDAKGDLIAASAADTAARLVAGTNSQILTADSAESTGLKWNWGGTAYARLTGNETIGTISPTLANSTALTLAMVASGVYRVQATLLFTTSAAGEGVALTFNGPASPTNISIGYIVPTAAVAAAGNAAAHGFLAAYDGMGNIAQTSAGPSTSGGMALFDGIIENGANAGNLVVRYAAETATDATLLRGSYLAITRLA